MSDEPTLRRKLTEALARFELAAPVEWRDAEAVRNALRPTFPDHQLEAYSNDGRTLVVVVALASKVLERAELVAR